MDTAKGILHIVRNFHDVEGAGVYDVAFTMGDNATEPNPRQPIRRFFGEQQLTEFLKKHLRRDRREIEQLLQEVERTGHARIEGLELPTQELRNLDLAA